ncbi:MAG: cadherin-like beta sandwich domain-containing protein, partial [Verrucomicrobiota bacterium]
IAVDSATNLYVADAGNNRIRKITPAGEVFTLAGSQLGYLDGTGAAARFSGPSGVAVDRLGTVYVADSDNNRIRKITPAGVVTTLAGSTSGYLDATGTAAQFSYPAGVAVDAVGNVYVADAFNNRIRKISPAAEVSTLAVSTSGYINGTGAAAQFESPWALAVHNAGNLYVGESLGSRLRKVTAAGVVTTVAGYFSDYRDGIGTAARFNNVMGVALDSVGNVYLGDRQNNRVRKVVLTRPALVLAQSGVTGVVGQPASLTLTNLIPETTYYYWAEGGNAAGTNTGTILSVTTLSTNALLNDLALSAGTLGPVFASNIVSYATIVSNGVSSLTVTPTAAQTNATLKVNGTTVASGVASSAINLVVGTNELSIAVTAQDGVTTNFYTVSVWRHPAVPVATTLAASRVTTTGAVLNGTVNPGGAADAYFTYSTSTGTAWVVSTLAGSGTSGSLDGSPAEAQFVLPVDTAVDGMGNVYVADFQSHRIRKITPAGVVSTLAGSTSGYAEGLGTQAMFNCPSGVAVDGSGNVYVADLSNNRIRKITPAGEVTTLAGNATSGYADGTGAAATFAAPGGLAVDATGNVYVADTGNNLIRRITAAGEVTTLAGSGVGGFADGTGTNAVFNSPSQVAVDSATNVYLVDGNNRIRKITPAGDVTTLAGSGVDGYADGNGTNASFSQPYGLAADADGNVYVADTGNNCIRKITPTGDVSTLAGDQTNSGYLDGMGAAARFNGPYGLAVDAATNVFVVDQLNDRVRKVTPAGVVTTVTGSSQGSMDGPANVAQFHWPAGVAVDREGTLYVGDWYNHSIRKIAFQPGLLTRSGLTGLSVLSVSNAITGLLAETTYYCRATGTNMMGFNSGALMSFTTLSTNASLSGLALSQGALTPALGAVALNYGVALANSVTTITITPTLANANATMTINGGTALSGAGYQVTNLLTGTTTLTLVVTAQDGLTVKTYLLDIFRMPPPPTVTTVAASGLTSGGATLNASINPNGGAAGVYFQWLTSSNFESVVSTVAGSSFGYLDATGTEAMLNTPYGAAVDSTGNIFVADYWNHRIRKIDMAGVVTTFAGSGTGGTANGTGTIAQFFQPTGVAVDGADNVYVADFGNHLVRKITPAGVVTTLAGSFRGYVNGAALAARFDMPWGIAVDSATNVYVGDTSMISHGIRKITPAGVVTSLAGGTATVGGVAGFADGNATNALFNKPKGIAVDASGTVYVADASNHRIRKVTSAGVVSTLAGGAGGFADGSGTIAQFDTPTGLVLDSAGNVYV